MQSEKKASEERAQAAMRLVEEEEHRKVQMHFLEANRVEQQSYLVNVRRFAPTVVDDGDSVEIDGQIGFPNPAHPDDSTNIHD